MKWRTDETFGDFVNCQFRDAHPMDAMKGKLGMRFLRNLMLGLDGRFTEEQINAAIDKLNLQPDGWIASPIEPGSKLNCFWAYFTKANAERIMLELDPMRDGKARLAAHNDAQIAAKKQRIKQGKIDALKAQLRELEELV